MTSCWLLSPDLRPNFEQLDDTIGQLLDSLADDCYGYTKTVDGEQIFIDICDSNVNESVDMTVNEI